MFRFSDVLDKSKRVGRTFILLVLAAVITIVGYGYYVFVTQVSGRAVVSERIDALYQKIQLQARRHGLEGRYFSEGRSAERLAILSTFAGELVDDDVRGLVMYNREGVVVWSSDTSRVGGKGGANRDEIARAMRGEVVAVHPFGKRPLLFPRADGPADIFIPIHADDGTTMGIVVVSKDFSDVVSFGITIAVMTILFVGVLVALIWMFLHMVMHARKDQLFQEEGRVSAVLEQMPMGIAAVRKDGQIRVWNARMVAISGVQDAQEVVGKNAFDLPFFKVLGLDAQLRSGMAGRPFEADTHVTSSSHGGEVGNHWRGIPVFATSGKKVEYLLLLVTDIVTGKGR